MKHRMPDYVVRCALDALANGGKSLNLQQWQVILAMILVGEISVKNAGKLMNIMMMKK